MKRQENPMIRQPPRICMSEDTDFRQAHHPVRPGESFKQVAGTLVAGNSGQQAGGSGKRKVGP